MNGNEERKVRATMRFMAWLRKFSPEMHAAVVERMGGREAPPPGPLMALSNSWGLSGLGAEDPLIVSTTTTTTSSGWDWAKDALAFAKDAVPAYLAYDAQKDLMDLNMERARQGQDPIDPGLVAAEVTVQHELPAEARSLIDQMKMGGNVMLWAALGLGAFFLVRMLR
jgi:hypothetical protein